MNRNYFCSECNLSTQNPRLYLQHRRDLHGDSISIHECDLCIYATKHSTKLLRHRRTVHRGIPQNISLNESIALDETQMDDVRVLNCTMCTFFTINKTLLFDHIRVAHPNVPIYQCNLCNYSHYMKDRFARHQRYHTMHQVQCQICEFKTIYKWNLERHMRHHDDAEMVHGFRCCQCNFSAATKQSITAHETNHHRLNEFQSISPLLLSPPEDKSPSNAVQSPESSEAMNFNPLSFLKLIWEANYNTRKENMSSNEMNNSNENIETTQSNDARIFYCGNCHFR